MEDLSEYEELYNKNWLKSERKLMELHKKKCVPSYIRPNITADATTAVTAATTAVTAATITK